MSALLFVLLLRVNECRDGYDLNVGWCPNIQMYTFLLLGCPNGEKVKNILLMGIPKIDKWYVRNVEMSERS